MVISLQFMGRNHISKDAIGFVAYANVFAPIPNADAFPPISQKLTFNTKLNFASMVVNTECNLRMLIN